VPQRKFPGDCQEPDRQLDDHIEGSRLVSPRLNQCEPVQTSLRCVNGRRRASSAPRPDRSMRKRPSDRTSHRGR
jgi:hypothetical protein